MTMIYAVIECSEINDRRDLHRQLAEKLKLPPWYGMNLDALYDCLTEPGEEISLRLKDFELLEERLGGYASAFLRVLEEAGEGNPRIKLDTPQED